MPANVLWWAAVLIILLLAGFVAVSLAKKRLLKDDDAAGAGFTLADLRGLHREGRMSDEEFEKAKQMIVTTIRRVNERKLADKKPPPRGGSDQLLP